jgi:hypothetical protein
MSARRETVATMTADAEIRWRKYVADLQDPEPEAGA